jgi:hypothetical protein
MPTAIDFFATHEDEDALLDYLGEPEAITLHTWPISPLGLPPLARGDLGTMHSVMVVSRALGPPRLIHPDDAAMQGAGRAAVFNRMNWERLSPGRTDGLVDSNASPVLLWRRGTREGSVIHQSQIGLQADSMSAVSGDYERWVNRVTSWVRRRGTRVWGLERDALRPDLTIVIDHISSIYALPGALEALKAGFEGRR